MFKDKIMKSRVKNRFTEKHKKEKICRWKECEVDCKRMIYKIIPKKK